MKLFLKSLLLLFFTTSIFAQKTKINKILIPYRDKNLWGLSDTLGNIKVKPVYKEIKDFYIDGGSNFLSRYVVKSNKKYYVIDQNKKVLLPENNVYDSIYLNKYEPNYFWVYKKDKVGLYHKNKEIIPCLYDKISVVANGSYEVQKGKLSGLINSLGKLIIPIEYVNIHRSWDESDEKSKKFVWIAEGMLVEKKFYDIKIPEENLQPMAIDMIKEAVSYNAENEEAIKQLEKKYDEIGYYDKYSRYVIVTLNKKKGAVSLLNQKEIVSPLYDDIKNFATDKEKIVFLVKQNNKYGLVKEGDIKILDCEFDNIEYQYKSGIYLIEKDDKKGCIVFNTIYPYIKPKYLSIKSIDAIQVNNRWQFGLFEVTTEKGRGLVGENGVEFFRD